MIEYRFADESLRADVIDFINYVFSQAHCPHNFKTLIPKVYGDGRGYADIHAVALEDGRMRGTVAQYPISARFGGQALQIGFIGSVSTHPYARGKGYMIELMDMQAKRAKETGVDLMLLGGLRQRYEYYGYSPCGAQYVYRVNADNVRHGLKKVDASGINWKKFSDASASEIDEAYRLYLAQPVTGIRLREDFDIVLRTWGAEPYVILDGARVAGYADISGKDSFSELVLQNAADAPRFIKAWYAVYAPGTTHVTVPAFDRALNRAISAFSEGYELRTSTQARIVNLKNVVNACLHLKRATEKLADGEIVLQMDDETPVRALVKNGEIEVTETDRKPDISLTRLDMQQFLFSANRFMAPDFPDPTGWFPLPLFLYGADHF